MCIGHVPTILAFLVPACLPSIGVFAFHCLMFYIDCHVHQLSNLHPLQPMI